LYDEEVFKLKAENPSPANQQHWRARGFSKRKSMPSVVGCFLVPEYCCSQDFDKGQGSCQPGPEAHLGFFKSLWVSEIIVCAFQTEGREGYQQLP